MPIEGVVPFPAEFAARYRERGYWQDQTVGQVFAKLFSNGGDREAMVYGDERLSYAELGRRVDRLALNLLDLGYRPRDTVVMQLPNSSEFVYLFFALQRLGVIPLMALAAHREHEIGHYVDFISAKGYAIADRVGSFDFADFAAGIYAKATKLEHVFVAGQAPDEPWCVSIRELMEQDPVRDPSELDGLTIDPDDPCVFQLSGGTTGIPKVIPRSHNDYVFNSRSVAEWCGINIYTVLLIAAPIAHNLPLATPGLMGTFLKGGRIAISPTPRGVDTLSLIAREGVTQVEGVPAMFIAWLDDELIGQTDLSSVLAIRSGGQKCQRELKKRIDKTFPNAKLTEGFGMGEGLIMWNRTDDPDDVRLDTVGRPWCLDDEIRIVDSDENDVPDGEAGELLTRGPYTLRGYLNAPDVNARAFTADGFYRTGDLLRRLPSGYFVVEGRIKDLVNRGGEKISTEEVENLLLAISGVRNVSCVAVPDRVLGEKMCACVVLENGAHVGVNELAAHLTAAGLARFKHPEHVLVLDAFPLSPFGKVQKNKLAEFARTRLAEAQLA